MKRISFNPRFVNVAGNDLIPGKIHTIRQNYVFWKRFEGQDVALFTWEGVPYRKGSKQRVFCIKKIYHVQDYDLAANDCESFRTIAKNDGFDRLRDFYQWFFNGTYQPRIMAIIHFTDSRY